MQIRTVSSNNRKRFSIRLNSPSYTRTLRKRRGRILCSGFLAGLAATFGICATLTQPFSVLLPLSLALMFMCIKALLALARWLDSARPLRSVRHPEGGPAHRKGEPLHVHLLALGTRGDVEPMIAFGEELMRRGNGSKAVLVTVVAARCFEEEITGHGLHFAYCGVDRFEAEESWGEAGSLGEFLTAISKSYLRNYAAISQNCWESCKPAHVLICGIFGMHFAMDFADALDVPCWTIKFAPDTPTGLRPPFGRRNPPLPSWQRHLRLSILRRWWHKWLFFRQNLTAVNSARNVKLTDAQNLFRTEVLGLPVLTAERMEEACEMMPTIYAFSNHVIAKPKDWPAWHHVVGYFWLDVENSNDEKEKEALPKDLKALAEAYDRRLETRPICVTMGSMADAESSLCIEEALVEAVRATGRPCVVLTKAERFERYLRRKDDGIIVLESCPHDLLFPLCSIVIHHGGAGTTARAMRAGVASIVVPVLKWYDQAGWGLEVERLGVGKYIDMKVGIIDAKGNDGLESRRVFIRCVNDAIQSVADNGYCKRSLRVISKRLRAEDGKAKAVDVLLRNLLEGADAKDKVKYAVRRMAARNCITSRYFEGE